jgi:hypothetical protein
MSPSTRPADLTVVTIETHLGATYMWPDMPRAEIEGMVQQLPAGKGATVLSSAFTLSNISRAVAVIPWRIIRKILIDGKERWPLPV